jgi:lipid-A-disaccharide synthase
MTLPQSSILILAGEASGDLHGGALVRALRKKRADLAFFGIGGDAMAAAGVDLLRHVREMSFLGFSEVIRHLPFIRRTLGEIVRAMEDRRPAAVICIDYPGFNLRIARAAKRMRIPVVYYISPQVWAWGRGRVKKIAKCVDKMLVIFDFEEPIYKNTGMNVAFVGHPLKDETRPESARGDFFTSFGLDPDKQLLGILPGSRLQEVERLLPPMLGAYRLLKEELPDLQAAVGMAPTLGDEAYQPFLKDAGDVRFARLHTRDVMAHSDAALVASGTATLETAILGTPLVILYKMSPASYWIGRMLVKTGRIGLVNIVAGREVVPERIQDQATPESIRDAVQPMLTDPGCAERIRRGLREVSERLGPPGAAERAAEEIAAFLDAAASVS